MLYENIQDELAHYTRLWDAAQEKMDDEPIHPHPENEPEEIRAADLLIERRKNASNDELDWQDMLLLATDLDRHFHPERFNEAQKSKAAIQDISKRVAASPNPIEPWTAGKDQDLRVTPEFNDGEALRELTDLKIRFEALEREIHGAAIRGEENQENKLQKQLDDIRSKLEGLNDKITPNPFDL